MINSISKKFNNFPVKDFLLGFIKKIKILIQTRLMFRVKLWELPRIPLIVLFIRI